MSLLGPMTKAEAVAHAAERGLTQHYNTGECGDGGYGSRLYYREPGSAENQYGQPLRHADLSRLPGLGWYVAYYGPTPEEEREHD